MAVRPLRKRLSLKRRALQLRPEVFSQQMTAYDVTTSSFETKVFQRQHYDTDARGHAHIELVSDQQAIGTLL